MTVSKLKSSVFGMMSSFCHSVPQDDLQVLRLQPANAEALNLQMVQHLRGLTENKNSVFHRFIRAFNKIHTLIKGSICELCCEKNSIRNFIVTGHIEFIRLCNQAISE
ncbi:hypothetical protein [Hafnia alvei]|uniref:hypothetical protein n=1 Tax=Hafnia alvei TaxID=569 RepID=UPI0036F38C4C